MLYLEDFLELMENLPAELRDRFTEIRELDLQVQNGLDQNEIRVRSLFRSAYALPRNERQNHFDEIKNAYRKILEDSDEKVNLATTVHDLLKRYLAKLDVEISKFKMELEADKPGITEVLEQSLKGGKPTSNVGLGHKRERRRRRGGGVDRVESAVNGSSTGAWTNGHVPPSGHPILNGYGRGEVPTAGPIHHSTHVEHGPGIGRGGYSSYIRKSQSYPNRLMEMRPPGPPSQGIVTSAQIQQQHHQQQQQQLYQQQQQQQQQHQHHQQMHQQSSAQHQQQLLQQQQQLLQQHQQHQQQAHQQQQQSQQQSQAGPAAIRERVGTGSGSSGFLPSFTDQPESRHGRPRKLTSRVQEMLKEASYRHERLSTHEAGGSSSAGASTSHQSGGGVFSDDNDNDGEEGSESEMTDATDQNDQQRWCICNQVSYGEMVACDNKDCPFEWFHYQCVGITAPPKGKWFCPHCTAVMKRRNSKNLII